MTTMTAGPSLFESAYPRQPHEQIKSWLHRIADGSGMNLRAIQRVWWNDRKAFPINLYLHLEHRAQARAALAAELKAENDALMALARQGGRIDWLARVPAPDADVRGEEDARQLALPLSGWMK